MKQVTLTLPDSVADHLDEEFAFYGHANSSEYASEILQTRKEHEQAALTHLLLEGLQSGESIEATPEFWADLRAETDALIAEHEHALNKASAA